jgi:hypothetical protein
VAREAAAESQQEKKQCTNVGVVNVHHAETKRVHANSEPSDNSKIHQNTSTTVVTSKKPTQVRQIKRPRSLGVMSPQLHVTKKASRRLSDEFADIPAKRARYNFVVINDVTRDGRPQEHYNLSLTNFEPTKYTSGFSPYDMSNRGDVLQSPEYVSDIFQRLFHSEVREVISHQSI